MAYECPRSGFAIACIILNSLFLAITLVLLPLRIHARASVLHAFGWDDIFLIAAFVLWIPSVALVFWMITSGAGLPGECISHRAQVLSSKIAYLATVLQNFCSILARTSVAIFVVRIFGASKRVKVALYTWTALMAMSLAATGIAGILECSPVPKLWDYSIPGTCVPPFVSNIEIAINAVVTIIGDFLLALLPAYWLRKIKMNIMTKRIVSAVFALGLLPCSFAVARAAPAYLLKRQGAVGGITTLVMLMSFEAGVILIYAAVPALLGIFSTTRRRSPRSST